VERLTLARVALISATTITPVFRKICRTLAGRGFQICRWIPARWRERWSSYHPAANYIAGLFPELGGGARSGSQGVAGNAFSVSFVIVSGAYFDSHPESSALCACEMPNWHQPTLSTLRNKVLDITNTYFQASLGIITSFRLLDWLVAYFPLRGHGWGSSGGVSRSIWASSFPGGSRRPASRHSWIPVWIRARADDDPPIKPVLVGRAAEGGRRNHWRNVIGFPSLMNGSDRRELMRAIGDRTGLAIDVPAMTDALREREQRIAELSGHLLRVGQEEERKRISRELMMKPSRRLIDPPVPGMMETGNTAKNGRAANSATVEVVTGRLKAFADYWQALSAGLQNWTVAAIRKKPDLPNTGESARDDCRGCGDWLQD